MNKQQQIKAARILFGIVFVISTFLLLTLWSSETVPWLVKGIFILVMLISASMAFLNPEKSKQQIEQIKLGTTQSPKELKTKKWLNQKIEQIKLEITRKLEELKAKKELSNRKISVTLTENNTPPNQIFDEQKEYNNLEGDDFLANSKAVWQGEKTIEFLYKTRNSYKAEKRKVTVNRIVLLDRVLYFEGYCHNANEIRVFKFIRIEDRQVTDLETGQTLPFKKLFNLRQHY